MSSISDTASSLAMERTRRNKPPLPQPWFKNTCIYFKNCHQLAHNVMRKDNYSDDSVRNYLFLKNSCKRVVSHFKSTYYAKLSDEINAKGSADFWRAVRKLSSTAGGCHLTWRTSVDILVSCSILLPLPPMISQFRIFLSTRWTAISLCRNSILSFCRANLEKMQPFHPLPHLRVNPRLRKHT